MANGSMKSFVYVRLEQNPLVHFNIPLLKSIGSKFPDLYVIDIDNFSDNTLWQSIQELIQLSDKSIIFFKVDSLEASLFSLMPFLESLLDLEQKIQLIVENEHTVLNQLLSPLSAIRSNYIDEKMLFQRIINL